MFSNSCDNSKGSLVIPESGEEGFSFAMELAFCGVVPMVLKSAIELGLLELIKEAEHASAFELASKLPTNNPDSASMVDRILRLLTTYSILNCTLVSLSDGSGLERRYSLGPVCKFLTKNVDGVSIIAPLLLLCQEKVYMDSWHHLKDAVLEGGTPFIKTHDKSVYEYAASNPRFSNLFDTAMCENSTFVIKKIVESYKGFEGLNSLVDVGGGNGANLYEIISKYPLIKGYNFDLPHVIQDAPSYPGIEHVSGDMFESVPSADAIFVKWICHNWSNEHCEKLLKNCYEAVPENGKVIIVEFLLEEDPTNCLHFAAGCDMLMLNYTGGKERTEQEFESLAKRVGFQKFQKVIYACGFWIMELYK